MEVFQRKRGLGRSVKGKLKQKNYEKGGNFRICRKSSINIGIFFIQYRIYLAMRGETWRWNVHSHRTLSTLRCNIIYPSTVHHPTLGANSAQWLEKLGTRIRHAGCSITTRWPGLTLTLQKMINSSSFLIRPSYDNYVISRRCQRHTPVSRDDNIKCQGHRDNINPLSIINVYQTRTPKSFDVSVSINSYPLTDLVIEWIWSHHWEQVTYVSRIRRKQVMRIERNSGKSQSLIAILGVHCWDLKLLRAIEGNEHYLREISVDKHLFDEKVEN